MTKTEKYSGSVNRCELMNCRGDLLTIERAESISVAPEREGTDLLLPPVLICRVHANASPPRPLQSFHTQIRRNLQMLYVVLASLHKMPSAH